MQCEDMLLFLFSGGDSHNLRLRALIILVRRVRRSGLSWFAPLCGLTIDFSFVA